MKTEKTSENFIKRGSIYDHFYIGGSAWGATWDPFFQKMFYEHGPKIVKFYEKWSEMGLESTVLDETRGKWSGIT